MSRRAVFLDRDGVINHNWFNPATREWESPIRPSDFRLREGVLSALARLKEAGFELHLVSNQPSAAKGKCSLRDLQSVHEHFAQALDDSSIDFAGFYYSYAHPEAITPVLREALIERKPSPYFLERAITTRGLDRSQCWMVGDRDTDIECGTRAGVRTIQIESSEPDGKSGKAQPDAHAPDLSSAADIIIAAMRRTSA